MVELKSLLLNKTFSNFRQQKHQKTFFCCIRHRIQISDKTSDLVLLTLNFTVSPPVLVSITTLLLSFEILMFSDKNSANYGTELRL